MVDLVLDDLGCPAGEGFQSLLKLFILPTHLDGLPPLGRTDTGKGKASLLRVVWTGLFHDLRVEHDHVFSLVVEGDDKGRVKLSDIVTYFREFYEARRTAGLVVEKANSIYAKGGYTDAQAQRNILSNPFKRFEDMQMLHHTKTLGVIQVDESIWKRLTREEKQEIEQICDEKLEQYYQRMKMN